MHAKLARVAAIAPLSDDQPAGPLDVLTYGVYPQIQTLLIAYVEYYPSDCVEVSSGTWTVTQNPVNGTPATGTITGTLSNGDCPGVTFTFGAIYYTWTSTDPKQTHDTFAATWATPDGEFSYPETFDINLARIKIDLVPPPAGSQYVITAGGASTAPTMPVITATAQVLGIKPDPTPTTTFTWTAMLTVTDGRHGINDYSQYVNPTAPNNTTLGTAVFTLPVTPSDTLVGGDLTLSVTAVPTGQTQSLQGSTPKGLKIVGTNPQRADAQGYISTTVATLDLDGLAASDVTDDAERIACQESQQEQFRAAPDGGMGPVLISSDNGVGMYQLTSDDPFSDPNNLFNWQQNVTGGLTVFTAQKVPPAAGYPKALRNASLYTAAITGTVNPIRTANGLKPITITPAPAYTDAGIIEGPPTLHPPNQLLEDATRGYNGFAGPRLYGKVLHEFEPDLTYLESASLTGLGTNSLVWTRVPVANRGTSGDPNYVAHVAAQSPQCGN
jgi:hypothetical protein